MSATFYTAKKKAQEIERTYEQRLQDRYLDNARSYLESVYVPLHVALGHLTASYRAFRAHIDFATEDASQQETDSFRTAALAYDDTVRKLLDRGAAAFLTTALEERLQSFDEFLRESLYATEVQAEVLFSLGVSYLGMSTQVERSRMLRRRLPSRMRINFLGLQADAYEKQLIRAPLATRDFEEEFVRQTALLRALIKEVTLGAHGRVVKP